MTVVQFVDDDGEGTIASDVAGGAERIHRDVEGDDECLGLGVEAEYTCQGAQCGHCCSARHTRSRHHTNAQEQDEMNKERQIVRQSADETDGEGATGNLHHRA